MVLSSDYNFEHNGSGFQKNIVPSYKTLNNCPQFSHVVLIWFYDKFNDTVFKHDKTGPFEFSHNGYGTLWFHH